MKRLYFALSLAAGFLGGFASHYVTPTSVFAQTQTPAPTPREVRGESFVLTDPQGNTVATFGTAISRGSGRSVVLIDESDREIWRAPSEPRVQPLSER